MVERRRLNQLASAMKVGGFVKEILIAKEISDTLPGVTLPLKRLEQEHAIATALLNAGKELLLIYGRERRN